nr:BA14K family protein [uncultured Cohaesibacter sp.]
MKFSNLFIASAIAVSMSFGAMPVTVPGTSSDLLAVSKAQAQPAPPRRPRPPVRRSNNTAGAVAAGAIIGLAAGAIAAGAANRRYPPQDYRGAPPWCNVRACASRYRSFRAYDCTFQPYNGPRRYCRM